MRLASVNCACAAGWVAVFAGGIGCGCAEGGGLVGDEGREKEGWWESASALRGGIDKTAEQASACAVHFRRCLRRCGVL